MAFIDENFKKNNFWNMYMYLSGCWTIKYFGGKAQSN